MKGKMAGRFHFAIAGSAFGAATFLALGTATHAATITLIADDASGEDWSTGARWSDGQPAVAGSDYFVGSGAGKIVRSTNNSASASFPGDSLELDATGILRLKSA